jgi:uncharacterized protein (DUF2164 family)
MTKIDRTGNLLTEDQRRKAINDIVNFFSTEREEEIGVIAAESLLDMFLQDIAPHIYNKSVQDSKDFLKSRIEELEIDMEVLKKAV